MKRSASCPPGRSALRALIRRAIVRLEGLFGRQVWRRDGDALDELVATILSQNTTGANSRRAYQRLTERMDNWQAVADAPLGRIERAIRPAGLARQRAQRIRAILRAIRAERGELSLEFLADWPVGRAYDYLRGFKGVGAKTAACVLLFSFNMPILPVDTHIDRIARRLGLFGPAGGPEQTQALLQSLVPPGQFFNLHILLIKLGRRLCRPAKPRCQDCPLLTMCPTGARMTGRRSPAAGQRQRVPAISAAAPGV